MYLGIAIILIGIYHIFSEYYDMETLFSQRLLVEKREVKWKEYFKLKIALGIFSIVIGLLLIFNFLKY